MPEITIICLDGRLPEERENRSASLKKQTAFSQPVPVRRSTVANFWKKQDFLMKSILRTLRIPILATARGSSDMRTGTSRRQRFTTLEAERAVHGIISLKSAIRPETIFI